MNLFRLIPRDRWLAIGITLMLVSILLFIASLFMSCHA